MSGLSSALSKLGIGKHKKTKSQSSSSPSSPRQSLDTASPRTRQSLDAARQAPVTPTKRQNASTTNLVAADTGDRTGHARPFLDEKDRPALPTTISNVNNPDPNLSAHTSKQLPTIPGTPGEGTYDQFPLPPTTHVSDQPPRLPEIPRSEPLHHVDSVNREGLLKGSEERPKPVVASSQGLSKSEEKVVEGRKFGHVRETSGGVSGSPLKKEHRVVDGLDTLAAGESVPGVEVPERGSSKLFSGAGGNTSSTATSAKSALAHRPDLISVRDPAMTPDTFISNYLSTHSSLHPTPALSRPTIPLAKMNLVPGPQLEIQRHDLVKDIVSESHGRKQSRKGISEFGKTAFKAAGMADKLDTKDSVDVHTTWLEPVVQEHIIRKEHTEYTVIINREIHKYHIYPKIQPISDPNPILLQPRHRIFSSQTGKWHEVIGDAAAIEILGEDVFHNGPKEKKMIRGMALPGFGEVTRMTAEERREHGLDGEEYGGGGTYVREGLLGQELGPWNLLGSSKSNGETLSRQSGGVGSLSQPERNATGQQTETVGYAI